MANTQHLSEAWARVGTIRDKIADLERELLIACRTGPVDVGRWLRSAFGCIEGAREMVSCATAAIENAARSGTPTSASPVPPPPAAPMPTRIPGEGTLGG